MAASWNAEEGLAHAAPTGLLSSQGEAALWRMTLRIVTILGACFLVAGAATLGKGLLDEPVMAAGRAAPGVAPGPSSSVSSGQRSDLGARGPGWAAPAS